jgi:hypothetical protein
MKKIIYQLNLEIFKVMLVGSLIFLSLEAIKPRSVLAFLNFNAWLVVWLISGIMVLILNIKTKG